MNKVNLIHDINGKQCGWYDSNNKYHHGRYNVNLVSCKTCAIVFDKEYLNFPTEDEIYFYGGEANTEKSVWDGDKFIPIVYCKACGGMIRSDGE